MSAKNDIFFRRGTSSNWSSVNPTLRSAELGYDTTEKKFKIGDGSTPWNSLEWSSVIGVSGEAIFPEALYDVSGIFFDTSFGPVDQVTGQLNWNNETGTIDVGLTQDLTMHIGQDIFFRVKNSTGSPITKGEAVAATGVIGGGEVVQIAPFAVDGSIDEVRFIGLVADDIANGEDGYVVQFGHVKNVDLRTSNTTLNPNAETWAVGDILFVDDSSAGGLTKVQPKDDIYVAMVLDDGQNGELLVRITDPGHISDLHDVNTNGVTNQQYLTYQSSTDTWIPTSSGIFTSGIIDQAIIGDIEIIDNTISSLSGDLLLYPECSGYVGINVDEPNSMLHVYSSVSGDNLLNVEGTYGSLLFVDDNLSGSIFSVNNVAGFPIFEVFSDDSVVAGRYGENDFVISSGGNVGIGTDSPVSKLDVSGVITATGGDSDEWNQSYDWVSASGGLPFASGTGSAGHVAFWTDTNQLSYDNAQLYWDSSNNRLGVGTSSPTYNIHTKGSSDAILAIEGATNQDARLYLITDSRTWSLQNDGDSSIGTDYFHIRDLTASADRLVIDTNGNIGINNTSPAYTLDVAGTANITGNVIVGGNVTVNGTTVSANVDTMEVADPILTLGLASGNIVTNTNLDRGIALALNDGVMGFMGWDTSENEFSLLSSGVASNGSGNYAPGTYGDLHVGNLEASGGYFSGNVGIGTSSPSYPLHVAAGSSYAYFSSNAVSAIKSVRGSSQNAGIDIGNTVGTWTIGKATDGFFGFSHNNQNINGSALVAITTAGNVGIGDTTPSYKLDVNGTAGFSSTIYAANIGADTSNNVVVLNGDGLLKTDQIDSRVWGSTLADADDIAYVSGLAVGASGVNGTGSSGQVAFWTGTNDISGESNLYWDQSNDRLGVGTTSPDYKLDIGGDTSSTTNTIRMVQEANGTAIRVGSGGNNDVSLIRVDGNVGETDNASYGFSVKYMGTRSGNNNSLSIFSDNGASTQIEALTMLQDGKVGLGIIEPSGTLHVVGTAHVDNLKLDGNTLSATNTDGNLILSPNGNGALQADSGGNARGAYAVDLQRVRTADTQVASATASNILGGCRNTNSGSWSTISGGYSNLITGAFSNIGGGYLNRVSSCCSTIGGGVSNCITVSQSVIAGGRQNCATGGASNTVSGGCLNCSEGFFSVVGGGCGNRAAGNCSVVSGGRANYTAINSTVSGGLSNSAGGNAAFIGGGRNHTASGNCSTIGGGCCNTASNTYDTVAGGRGNTASGSYSSILGGVQSQAEGMWGTVVAGRMNRSTGNYSFIGGGYSNLENGPGSNVLVGGYDNFAGSSYNFIGGGRNNCIDGVNGNRSYNIIPGGFSNCINIGTYNNINGGCCNCIGGYSSSIIGGRLNTIQNSISYGIAGGRENNVYCDYGIVLGGTLNVASGDYSAVVAGSGNVITGDCSFIAGGFNNSITNVRSTINGGVANTSTGFGSTVGGGASNQVTSTYTTIGGGTTNTVSGYAGVVGGGKSNKAMGTCSTVGGGQENCACGCYSTSSGGYRARALGHYSTVSGGYSVTAGGGCSTVGGGRANSASGNYSTIGGGSVNNACGVLSTISGGSSNTAIGTRSTISGGLSNQSPGDYSTVGGGRLNTASGACSTISGGCLNCSTGTLSTVAGGNTNCATGYGSTVSGGYLNCASGSGSVVGGGCGNIASAFNSVVGGGGGGFAGGNTASGNVSTVSGGYGNCASGACSTVGGGQSNCASGGVSIVSGGRSNTASSYYSTVAGGYSNNASGNSATIAGGYDNTASGACSTVSGGISNQALGTWSTVSGGNNNSACLSSTVAGGVSNTAVATNCYATIGGGYSNNATGGSATIAGGYNNNATTWMTTVGGGCANTAGASCATVAGGNSNSATGINSTISGGRLNNVSGNCSTISGGNNNTLSGDYSFAVGNSNDDNGYDNVHILGSNITATQADTTYTQNIIADGHLAATTKSFLINHPTRPGHKLQYGSLESPYHGVRLTGRDKITSGWCVVKLPEYIRELVHDNEDVNIQLTNYRHGKTLYVSEVNVAHNEFTVKTDSWFGNDLEFFWSFTATRKDIDPLRVEY